MDTDIRGLSSGEAEKLLEQYGPNVLPEKPPPSNLKIFLSQLKNPLVYVLVVAGLVTTFLGDIADTAIIAFAVLINTVLGFVQEQRAGRAIYALKKMVHPNAKVVRDGKVVTVDSENLVPGDVVILSQGDRVPADGKLIEQNRFFVTEAMLTGESVPVGKKIGAEVFMGTIVTGGRAKIQVVRTGEETKMGKIALDVQEQDEDTPLKRQLNTFSKQLTLMVVGLLVFVFIIGVVTGKPLEEIFTTAVALAVSSIPEGLLVALTVVLAIGIQRAAKRKALVRHLVSAETLGGVTTICVDKTGTLTEGKMRVVDVLGEEEEIAQQMVLANDMDSPMLIAAWEWALLRLSASEGQANKLKEKNKQIDSIPFTSENKFYASLHSNDNTEDILLVNGAPDILLPWCKCTKKQSREITKSIDDLTSQGKRVLGLARKSVNKKTNKLDIKSVKKSLEWVGVLAFNDPVRPGIKDAFAKTESAGIGLMVITGDYPQTARVVLEKIGYQLKDDQIVLGSELKNLSSESLAKKIKRDNIMLFARTTPDQKLKIVDSLKKNGEVVAMMGDGVNDAPALKKADIGIVVGEATDVAKETADLVLLDSNFATIVASIEEGRGIFDNMRKVILYLMSDAFEGILAVTGTLILGLPLPVSAAQILWINLISDGFPNLALTVDPKTKDVMQRPPRPSNEHIVSRWMREIIAIVSLSGGIMALIIFYYYFKTTGDLMLARSVAFATLGVNSLIYVFSVRTLREPFWRENPFDNMWLNVSVIGGMMLQFVPFTLPILRNAFNLTTLSVQNLISIFAASIVMFIIIEVTKEVTKLLKQ